MGLGQWPTLMSMKKCMKIQENKFCGCRDTA